MKKNKQELADICNVINQNIEGLMLNDALDILTNVITSIFAELIETKELNMEDIEIFKKDFNMNIDNHMALRLKTKNEKTH